MYNRINVIMSTYNGEMYVEEQINSIINQKDVDIFLTIRDDGSTDKTLSILKMIQINYPLKIKIIEGENIGWRKSFFCLLQSVDNEFEYVAFSDQDDVWKENKLIRAIDTIKSDRDVLLYSSALEITDSELNIIGIKSQNDIVQSIESFFIRTRIAGCTMVLKKELVDYIKTVPIDFTVNNQTMPDHDSLVCMSCMILNKKIYIDTNSYILHRRLEHSVTGGGKGFFDRIKIEKRRIFNRKYSYSYTSKILLESNFLHISNRNRVFLEQIQNCRQSFINRIKLIFNKNFTSGSKLLDIPIYIKILLNIY